MIFGGRVHSPVVANNGISCKKQLADTFWSISSQNETLLTQLPRPRMNFESFGKAGPLFST
jgi:hypothetical protein